MRVLVTRPEDDAVDTVRQLEEAGHEALVSPMLEIRFTDFATLPRTDVQAWLLTSRNGVRALARLGADRDVPVMAVGRSTAALARDLGFSEVHDADGDVGDLVSLVASRLKSDGGRLFHAAGKHVAGDLAGMLNGQGFLVDREVLYGAEPVGVLGSAAAEALANRQIDAALFFSARSAGVFASLFSTDRRSHLVLSHMTAICISEKAAAELSGLPFADTRVARRPNQDALLAELNN
jgi:uroporphyrinogen-III synthase